MKNNLHAKIIVVDDEPASLESMTDVLDKAGYDVTGFDSGAKAVAAMPEIEPDLVITDLRMQDMDGLAVMEKVKAVQKDVPVIIMTAFTTMETAIEAIQNGAYDYVSKPFKLDHLRLVVKRALEQARLVKENRRLRSLAEKGSARSDVIGRSPDMVEIYKLVAKVAPLPTTVLIQGESGTGKEVIARLLHAKSGCKGPFMAVNCGALAESLLESELFGHVKGAFTGAVTHKSGIFETAENGTCFLDEISNTSKNLQMKLLRVLEEGEMMRVGSTQTVRVQTRVIAATNQPLEKMVAEGLFREDLYFRLKVVTIQLPPLRERQGDVPLLLDYFVGLHAARHQKNIAIEKTVYPVLEAYSWPGNVREMSNAVERAVALNRSGVLTLEDFHTILDQERPQTVLPDAHGFSLQGLKPFADVEAEYLQYVLRIVQGNVSRAAEILDIDRRTVYRILQRGRKTP